MTVPTPVAADLGFFERLRLVVEAHVAMGEADAAQLRALTACAVADDALGVPVARLDRLGLAVAVAIEASEGAGLLHRRSAGALRRLGELVWPDDAAKAGGRTIGDWLWEPFTRELEGYWARASATEQAEELLRAQRAIDDGEAAAFWRTVWTGAEVDENALAWALALLHPAAEAKIRHGAVRRGVEQVVDEMLAEKVGSGELWRCAACERYFEAARHAPAAPGLCGECVDA